jgi:hypothetical protein
LGRGVPTENAELMHGPLDRHCAGGRTRVVFPDSFSCFDHHGQTRSQDRMQNPNQGLMHDPLDKSQVGGPGPPAILSTEGRGDRLCWEHSNPKGLIHNPLDRCRAGGPGAAPYLRDPPTHTHTPPLVHVLLHSTQRASKGFWPEMGQTSVTLSLGNPLCPYPIAYRRAYGLSFRWTI